MAEAERVETVEIPRVEDIIVPVAEIKVPARFLPAEIPAYQRLRDAPYKFKAVIVYFKGWSPRFTDTITLYYLTDEMDCLIRLDDPALIYVTRNKSKVYKIRIFREELPKELKVYANCLESYITQWGNEEVTFSVPKLNVEVKLKGDISVLSLQEWHDLFVSLWFRYVVPRIPPYAPSAEQKAPAAEQP
jgi:hypothetical protein